MTVELKGKTCECGHTEEFHTKNPKVPCRLCHSVTRRDQFACKGFAPMRCPDCGETDVRTKYTNDPFPYRDGEDKVILECVVPVRRCAKCDMQFLDWETEEARGRVVQEHHIKMEVARQSIQKEAP